jgi:hypothetical protein
MAYARICARSRRLRGTGQVASRPAGPTRESGSYARWLVPFRGRGLRRRVGDEQVLAFDGLARAPRRHASLSFPMLAHRMTGTIHGMPTMRYLRLVGVGVAVGIALVALVAWDSIWPSWTGLRGRTLWDLADLFIIPISLAVIGYLFSNAQRRQERALAETERATDREIARTREQHAALQAYLSAITELLVSGNMQEDAFRPLARSRTLVILESLDSSGKRDVVRFLKEAGLLRSRVRASIFTAPTSAMPISVGSTSARAAWPVQSSRRATLCRQDSRDRPWPTLT